MALFAQRKEFEDVPPLPQDDGPHPACAIAYTPEFRDAMDYFRALNKSQEVSERALALTTRVIELNPANYTVWHYRRYILRRLPEVDLRGELEFISEIIEDNLKNYQVWHHRQAVVDLLNDGSQELEFTARMLAADAKNYHAWTHRHWAIERFKLLATAGEQALEFVEQLLTLDLWNNSAWNHRYFVMTKMNRFSEADYWSKESEYIIARLRLSPHNEAAWNYLRGVIKAVEKQNPDISAVEGFCDTLIATEEPPPAHALSFLADIFEARALVKDATAEAAQAARERAKELCGQLCQIDPIRVNYWQYRKEQIDSGKAGPVAAPTSLV